MSWILRAIDTFNNFTADVFWNVATSPAVLLLIALLFLAAFMVAHVPLVDRLFPMLTVYTRTAALVQIVAFFAFAYLLGFKTADDRAEVENLQTQIIFKNAQLEAQEATARDAEQLRNDAEARAAEAKNKLLELEFSDATAANCGFTADDVARLRDLRRRGRQKSGAGGR